MRKIVATIRNLFRRENVERDIDAEVRSYADLLQEEKMSDGMNASEAKRSTRMSMGGPEQLKEEIRNARAGAWLEALWQDLRFALRMLRKNPGFTAVAILTLALGIGANVAMFSVVRAVIFRPLPFPNPDRLAIIQVLHPDISFQSNASLRDFVAWQSRNHTFESVAAINAFGGSGWIKGSEGAENVSCQKVTWEFFSVLGVPAERGRVFNADEDSPTGPRVVVLSDEFWESHYLRDEATLGREININDQKFTVIGVMPPGYGIPNSHVDMWAPLAADRAHLGVAQYGLIAIGRLKPGISIPTATADLQTLSPWLGAQRRTKYYLRLASLRNFSAGESRLALLVLFGALGSVLLIVCANLSNLLSMRTAGRKSELAIREALGAGRWRLSRQMFTESSILALFGGLAGLLVSLWLVRILVVSAPASLDLPNLSAIRIDGLALLFTLGVSFLAGLFFGIAPALHFNRANFAETLKNGNRGSAVGSSGRVWRSALVIAEIAISLLLLAGAGLMLRTLFQMQKVELGFKPDHVLTISVDAAGSVKYGPDLLETLLDRIRKLPGVQSAGSTTSPPLSGMAGGSPVWRADDPQPRTGEMVMARVWRITTGYMDAMKIPLLRGRNFDATDGPKSFPVAMVNQTLANHFFPNQNPIGKRVLLPGFGDPKFAVEIVGVVADTRATQLTSEPGLQIYFCNAQNGFPFGTLVTRSASDPSSVAAEVRREIRSLSPDLIPGAPKLMEFYVEKQMAKPRVSAILLGGFAALAALLAAVGVFGVVSYSVSSRTQEIGIRMALGASRGNILWLVLREGLTLALIGATIGLGSATLTTRVIQSLLFGVHPGDMLTFVTVTLALISIAALACYLPARRAMRVDPIIALRYE